MAPPSYNHLRLAPQPALGFPLPKAWAAMEWTKNPMLCKDDLQKAGTEGHIHCQVAQATVPKMPETQHSFSSSQAVPLTWGALHCGCCEDEDFQS